MNQRNWMISNGLELENTILLKWSYHSKLRKENTMLKTEKKKICKSFIWQGVVLVYIVKQNAINLVTYKEQKFIPHSSAAAAAAATTKSLQSCPTLCDPIDSSSSGSAVPGILQARTLEWVAIYFSNEWK